jgi:Mn-dependent DtxR family transcriptional regulator
MAKRLTFAAGIAEIRRPKRAYVLRTFALLEQHGSEKIFPLSSLMTREVLDRDVRNALRSLHKAGLVKFRGGGYGLTSEARTLYRWMQRADSGGGTFLKPFI